jgi:catechol 2,3-dioxygenase-like lactoylglutathione lyase family enzyme
MAALTHAISLTSQRDTAMTDVPRPDIDCERYHTSLFVPDVPAALEFYTQKLGFTVGFTWGSPMRMAGVNLGEVQIFLEHTDGAPGQGFMSFVVGNADALYEYHRANGIEVAEDIEDREYGLRDYAVRDLNGYMLSFGHYIYSNIGPPLEIERVAVPVRLEKRLAALLHDLAAYKRMSLSSCLEEILLHTNEPLGDGVASPHTKAQLRYIQELKAKHGIDYDSHASYRFVESDPH